MNSDPDKQIPFLSFGFRPFFLFAGLYAVAAMAAWIAWLMLHAAGGVATQPTIAVAAHLWHGHEMLFGYVAAVVSGFMLTAVPSWTGARRIAGTPLLVLAATWTAGRLAMWFSAFLPAPLVAAVDLLHLPLLAAMVAAGLLVRPAPRNLVFLGLLALIVIANAAVHAEWTGLLDGGASWGLRLAILTYVLMIVIIGGRVVPSFTRNALVRWGMTANLPRNVGWLDAAGVATVVACLASAALDWPAALGWSALAAGIANAARMLTWRPMASLAEPILWSLHLGFLATAAGLLALAGAELGGYLGETAALHILSIGGIGGMTLAIMTRAALGHTGRALAVSRPVALAYGLVAAAALARGFGTTLLPEHYFTVMAVAAGLWTAAFGIFSVGYAAILTGPSRKGAASA